MDKNNCGFILLCCILATALGCSSGGNSDPDATTTPAPDDQGKTPSTDTPATDTPAPTSQGLAGRWMMTSTIEETLTIDSEYLQHEPSTSRTTSRQLVTITEDDAIHIEYCGEVPIAAISNDTGIQYNIDLPANVRSLNVASASTVPVTLVSENPNLLRGGADSGSVALMTEIYQTIYHQKQDVELVRISDASDTGIGSLAIEWSFLAYGVETAGQRDETVLCLGESFRETSDTEVWWYTIGDSRSPKDHSMVLVTPTLEVTYEDQYSLQDAVIDDAGNVIELDTPVPAIYQTTSLEVRPIMGSLALGQTHLDLTDEEINSVAATSTTFVRQPLTIGVNSASGTFSIERDDQFIHSQIDLNW